MKLTYAEAQDHGYTKAYRVSHGAASLDVYVKPDANLCASVHVWHPETLALLSIAGWSRVRWEPLDEAEQEAATPHGWECAQ